MKRTYHYLLVAILLLSQSCTTVKAPILGQKIYLGDIDKSVLTPDNNLVPAFDTTFNNITYTVGVANNTIIFVSTNDPDFHLDNMKIGGYVKNKYKESDIMKRTGWGRFIKLNDDWYAATSSQTKNDDFIIEWFFKYNFDRNKITD